MYGVNFTIIIIGSSHERCAVASATEAGCVGDLITIPTLHLHGLKDENLNNGRKQLATFYEPEITRLLEINHHHAMPWEKSEILELAEMMTELYNEKR